MPFWKKIPFLSINLLIITYALFGWSIAEATSKLWIWLTLAGIIVGLIFFLVRPVGRFRNILTVWLQSDVTAFLSIIIFALIAVMLVTRLDVLVQWLILFVPGYLACLDLQRAGCNPWMSFAIAVILALLGYGAGIVLQQQFGEYLSVISHQLSVTNYQLRDLGNNQ